VYGATAGAGDLGTKLDMDMVGSGLLISPDVGRDVPGRVNGEGGISGMPGVGFAGICVSERDGGPSSWLGAGEIAGRSGWLGVGCDTKGTRVVISDDGEVVVVVGGPSGWLGVGSDNGCEVGICDTPGIDCVGDVMGGLMGSHVGLGRTDGLDAS